MVYMATEALSSIAAAKFVVLGRRRDTASRRSVDVRAENSQQNARGSVR